MKEKLDEVTDTFFENVTGFHAGCTPTCVAIAVLVYHLASKMKVRKGPMLLRPAVKLFANNNGKPAKLIALLMHAGTKWYLQPIACLHTGGAWEENNSNAKTIGQC